MRYVINFTDGNNKRRQRETKGAMKARKLASALKLLNCSEIEIFQYDYKRDINGNIIYDGNKENECVGKVNLKYRVS